MGRHNIIGRASKEIHCTNQWEQCANVTNGELSGRQDIAQLPEVMVIYKHNVDSDTMQKISAILADYGLEQKTFLMRQTVYGDIIVHYVNESLS